MIRRTRLLLTLLALATFSLAPAVFADDAATSNDTSIVAQVVDYVMNLIEGDDPDGDGEVKPIFLPGG